MTHAFVLGGVRTPVGRYGGSLSPIGVDDVLGRTMVAAWERFCLFPGESRSGRLDIGGVPEIGVLPAGGD
jgi:hypothetical protein